jgi:hypothetical protein
LQEDSTLVTGTERERVHQLWVSGKRGAPSIEGGFDLAEEKRFWEFQVLGFLCRCNSTILGGFQRYCGGGFICIERDEFPRGGRTIFWRVARSKGLAGPLMI